MKVRVLLASAVLLGALGCDDPEPVPTDGGPERELTYYEDLKPIIDAHCVRCHAEGGVGPFRLDSYETVRMVATILPFTVEARQMPPFLAAPVVRPLLYDISLSDAQIAMFAEWVENGSPMGDPAAEGPPIELATPRLERVDRMLSMPEPYTPRELPDEYRCFVLDWQETAPTHITRVEFRPGNLAIAHHAVIYLIDAEHTGIVDDADGADGAMGYPCFGGAAPDGATIPTKLVAAWVPGMGAIPYPAGTGALVEPGARVILQMHYSILSDSAQPDRSEVAFQLAEAVEHGAGYLPWIDIDWPTRPETMLIPAGEAEVTHEHVADPTESPLMDSFVPGADPSEGLIIYSVLPHMHKLGVSMSLQVERADGAIEPMVEIPRWDFDWQSEFWFESPITVVPGDRVRMRCTWDNSAANQPIIDGVRREPEDVVWGEGTYDEMCASSMFVRGLAVREATCEDHGSEPADMGRFVATFDASDSVRRNVMGELAGPVYASIYRDEDVSALGPRDGAEPVGGFTIESLDLEEGPSDALPVDVELPAGDYQILGFMDVNGNVDPASPSPDRGDPVLIPGRALALRCESQPIRLSFALLLP